MELVRRLEGSRYDLKNLVHNIAFSAVSIFLISLAAIYFQVIGFVIALGLFSIAMAAFVRSKLSRLYLLYLGILLTGYALLGKGFAYLGVSKVFIGEVSLALGLVSLLVVGGLNLLYRSIIFWFLVAFMLLGFFDTLPYFGEYGLDAFRDAVVWGYGTFAIFVSVLVLKTRAAEAVVRLYSYGFRIFLFWIPFAIAISILASDFIPRWPSSSVPILDLKGGDIAVHLAGVMVYIILGLHKSLARDSRARLGVNEWGLWILWFAALVPTLTGRAALLTVSLPFGLLLLFQPQFPLFRWGRFFALSIMFVLVFGLSGMEINFGTARSVSLQAILVRYKSVVVDTGINSEDGTRSWRLAWWQKIWNYTVSGPYFWTGKGYGINLADADGFQVNSDHSLRSPHNAEMTILARSGVPGLAIWLTLQGIFAYSLLSAYFNARIRMRMRMAKINLWILLYWLAFMVNGSFDVFLEGPQGGIWFWCLFGFGMAWLELQRQGEVCLDEEKFDLIQFGQLEK